MSEQRTVIVLAAGEGKRMKSALPKVLHTLLGRSLVGHVLAAAAPLEAQATLVVVGHGAERVREHLGEIAPAVAPVVQAEQRGTGHAVRVALPAEASGTVVVLNGDLPLVRSQTLVDLVERHERDGNAATLLTAEVADPSGLGRIITGEKGLERIVEERDASPAERAIHEINAGAYAFDAGLLRDALGRVSTDNDQGEEYLTDVLGLLVAGGHPVRTHLAGDPDEALGANDRAQLAQLRAVLRDRINEHWMREGVSIIDPATTWLDVTVSLGRDVVVEPNTQLRGSTVIGEGALVGPDTTLTDVSIGDGASVVRTHGSGAQIGAGASVGPFAYLRAGTVLGRKGKIGTFVEVKNADIGSGSKVPHLSYIGDATIGEHTNIGAASVTVNYDGVDKHRTVIGDYARTGADNMFVAPVEVGDGAYTGAGTVVRRDVPPGSLAVSNGPQRIFEGWTESHRPGTPAAEAAQRALRAADTPEAAADTETE
ncbi:bifunctional UDP-N-acetylglucosamine diphosphorylase/glucosamine-1-phosphate N-acetyltransferase GlmU [Rugosimonospora acidiphila]|uniref:Bifunctional protein GlmU n=1 Tax=Rugosimonospora acidiphila TaxID=556531 RepID=A0ABP9SBA7_9ACTN